MIRKDPLVLLMGALIVFLPTHPAAAPPLLACAYSPAEAPANPPGRLSPAFAYDAGLRRIVLFGGESWEGLLSDTWFWNGRQWRQAHPSASPVSRPVEIPPGYGMECTGNAARLFTVPRNGPVMRWPTIRHARRLCFSEECPPARAAQDSTEL